MNCPSTAPIEMNVSGLCLITISSQTGIGPVKFSTTATTPSTITAEINEINEINAIATTRSGLCGAEAAKNEDYTGDVTFEGTTSASVQTAIKVVP